MADVGLLPEKRCDMYKNYNHLVPAVKAEEWEVYTKPSEEIEAAGKAKKVSRRDERKQTGQKRAAPDSEQIGTDGVQTVGGTEEVSQNNPPTRKKRGRPRKATIVAANESNTG